MLFIGLLEKIWIFPTNSKLKKALRGPIMLCYSVCGLGRHALQPLGACEKRRTPSTLDPVYQNLYVTRFPGDLYANLGEEASL